MRPSTVLESKDCGIEDPVWSSAITRERAASRSASVFSGDTPEECRDACVGHEILFSLASAWPLRV